MGDSHLSQERDTLKPFANGVTTPFDSTVDARMSNVTRRVYEMISENRHLREQNEDLKEQLLVLQERLEECESERDAAMAQRDWQWRDEIDSLRLENETLKQRVAEQSAEAAQIERLLSGTDFLSSDCAQ